MFHLTMQHDEVIEWEHFPCYQVKAQPPFEVRLAEPRWGYARTSFGSMQQQKLQSQSVIYRNPEHSNWHQRFPTHIWLFLAQCGMLAGFIKTMQAK